VGLPDGEEIMMLAFFVLTQYRLVTDGRTDTLLSQRPALVQCRAGKKQRYTFIHSKFQSTKVHIYHVKR